MSSQNPVPAKPSAQARRVRARRRPRRRIRTRNSRPPTEEEFARPAAALLVVVVVLGIIGWALWYFLEGRWYEGTDDAYVNGNVVQITPQIAGTVVSIGADDGDRVHAGDVLVQLDPSDADVALAEAKANLANTVRKVRGLYSNVNGAQGRCGRSARSRWTRRAPTTTAVATWPSPARSRPKSCRMPATR
jgi:multidrug resistance efflux pump